MDIGISGYCRAHVDADGRSVDELYLPDALCFHGFHMARQLCAFYQGFQSRYEAFQNQRGLAGPGHAGHDRKPSFRNPDGQRLHCVEGIRFQGDCAQGKQVFCFCRLPHQRLGPSLQERADEAPGIGCNFRNGAFSQQFATFTAGARSQFQHIIRPLQHIRVMIHQHDGIPVHQQVLHDTHEAFYIRRMQPDGRFIQDVQHPGGSVPDAAGQLGPLPLPGG